MKKNIDEHYIAQKWSDSELDTISIGLLSILKHIPCAPYWTKTTEIAKARGVSIATVRNILCKNEVKSHLETRKIGRTVYYRQKDSEHL